MGEIIAQTYELLQKIGSGGGGDVYLARHLRLNKAVVLKADKRKITTRPELLRREVDVLKNLRHTYIPQVYDFFSIQETVYTVMDYVEGESLDKPLKRGEHFSQVQVIRWARQLLEALCYLHSPTHGDPPRGFVHSDIKPANIMCRPNGDICLIDFNIALAIGEQAVVGGSAGYASPEHYGLDFSFSGATATQDGDGADETATLLLPDTSRSSSRRNVVPDVRSDIYSLGATLYHLLSGRRPAKDATDVVPLTGQEASPQVASIIRKAMNPNPDLRYQTAAEMLEAFNRLHENDPRTWRLKRWLRIGAGMTAACFLAGGLLLYTGLRQMKTEEAAARVAAEQAQAEEQAAKSALEDITNARQALSSGNRAEAIRSAVSAIALDTAYNAQAQNVLTEALGVYDLTDGYKPHLALTLPSEPLKLAVSPAGTYLAVLTSGSVHVFALETGEEVALLPADLSARSDMVFQGEKQLIYAGDGAIRAYDLTNEQELWSGKPATSIALSEDGTTVAALYKEQSFATIYNTATGAVLQTLDFNGMFQSVPANDTFADPEDELFVLSQDGQYLGMSFSNGALWVFDWAAPDNSVEIYDASDYTHFEGGFCGSQFAFAATGSKDAVFAVIDMEQLVQLGAFSDTVGFHTRADSDGIYVAQKNVLIKLDPETGEQTERAYTQTDIISFQIGTPYTMVLTKDSSYSFFDEAAQLLETHQAEEGCDFLALAGPYGISASLDSPSVRVVKLENHSRQQLFTYEVGYPHDEVRISADKATVMLFQYDRFRIYSLTDGSVLAEQEIPQAEQVYDQQYKRSGTESWLEVTYYDGSVVSYSAADGSKIGRQQGVPPDESLYEEFETEQWRITSPLHGQPEVYDRETGVYVTSLETEDYLTYVTQVGDYVMSEYVSADGERYGLLLDTQAQAVAKVPGLCDILPNGTLIFDDKRGNLRQSPLYTLEDLIALANGDV